MNKSISIGSTGQFCKRCDRCGTNVDVVQAKRKAEQIRVRELRCPKCGEVIGRLN